MTRGSVISLGGTRYSVPHQLIDETVFVRVDGDEVIIAHQGRDGVTEVARHRTAPPGQPQLNLEHYPPRSTSRILDHTPKPRIPEVAALLALGPAAAAWLVRAAAAGTGKVRVKMDQAVEFAAVYDQASILRHRRRTADPDRVVVPIADAHSLQPGTSRWQEVGR